MKTKALLSASLLLLAFALGPARAAVTYFYAPGGNFDQTQPITLTQTGEVFIETGGSISSNYQVDSGATIWVDGVQVIFSDHSIRDGSQSAVNALWDVVLPAGDHTIRTSVVGSAAGAANNTYSYIRLEDEVGPYDQEMITNITNAYEEADTALQEEMTTLIQNAETDLQNQIDATNANVTQLQDQLTALTQQVETIQQNQSGDEATIAQLQQEISADEGLIAELQAGQSGLQGQLQTLTDLVQAHLAALQAEIDSVSGQVTVLSNTTARKSSLTTSNDLIYGAAGVGAAGLGVGVYLLSSRHAPPDLDDAAMPPSTDDHGDNPTVFDNSPPSNPFPDSPGDAPAAPSDDPPNGSSDAFSTPDPTPQ